MSVCLTLGGGVLAVAASTFTLSWTHSVERTEWRERWTLAADGSLHALEARVRGSGAGMDPGDGARLENGWWVWTPTLPTVPSLTLALSGATGAGWTLCGDGRCREIGATTSTASDTATLAACGAPSRTARDGGAEHGVGRSARR